jgi:hypothetical protein
LRRWTVVDGRAFEKKIWLLDQRELLVVLGQARVFDRPSALETATAIRERLKGRRLGDVVADVRAERER